MRINWSKREGGRTAWTGDDHAMCVKLLHLIRLDSEWGRIDGTAPLTRELLGDPPYAAEVFDRWWTLERFGGFDVDFDEEADEIDAAEYRNLAEPARLLPRLWLADRLARESPG